ncbi:hypothetical protein [Streptomyces sp. LN325]|uniref:hypothetical protein n=1 Tax=Streptomyces sp. LN325 TaxID=3112976 RepID=UPI00371919FC
MSRNNTQDTIKDFIGDIADSTKKAFDEILDRRGDDGNCGDWITAGNPYLALHGLPGDVLRTVSALSALGGVANPVAALANAANATAGAGAANPLAALTGAAPNPLAALAGAPPPQLATTLSHPGPGRRPEPAVRALRSPGTAGCRDSRAPRVPSAARPSDSRPGPAAAW